MCAWRVVKMFQTVLKKQNKTLLTLFLGPCGTSWDSFGPFERNGFLGLIGAHWAEPMYPWRPKYT